MLRYELFKCAGEVEKIDTTLWQIYSGHCVSNFIRIWRYGQKTFWLTVSEMQCIRVHCVAGGAAAAAHGGIGEPSCILPPRARRRGSAKAVIGRWGFTLLLSLSYHTFLSLRFIRAWPLSSDRAKHCPIPNRNHFTSFSNEVSLDSLQASMDFLTKTSCRLWWCFVCSVFWHLLATDLIPLYWSLPADWGQKLHAMPWYVQLLLCQHTSTS